jgi:hypothetical protein
MDFDNMLGLTSVIISALSACTSLSPNKPNVPLEIYGPPGKLQMTLFSLSFLSLSLMPLNPHSLFLYI